MLLVPARGLICILYTLFRPCPSNQGRGGETRFGFGVGGAEPPHMMSLSPAQGTLHSEWGCGIAGALSDRQWCSGSMYDASGLGTVSR